MKNLIIVLLIAASFVWGYCCGKIPQTKACNDKIDWAIQDTSDELYNACEQKINSLIENGCKLTFNED